MLWWWQCRHHQCQRQCSQLCTWSRHTGAALRTMNWTVASASHFMHRCRHWLLTASLTRQAVTDSVSDFFQTSTARSRWRWLAGMSVRVVDVQLTVFYRTASCRFLLCFLIVFNWIQLKQVSFGCRCWCFLRRTCVI